MGRSFNISHHPSHITHAWLEHCLARIPRGRITVFGDFCVDAYWDLDQGDQGDQGEPEISIETGLAVRRVRQQRYSLGGAGNVAANLADLGVGTVRAVGVIGSDPFGQQMRELMRARRIDDAGMIAGFRGWQTSMYTKPMLGDIEQNRIDFGAFNELDEATMERAAAALDRAAAETDFVIFNQQLPGGVCTAPMIERINQIIARHASCGFIADARHRAGLYRNAMLKLNEREAARLCGHEAPARDMAMQLQRDTCRAVFITRGEAGIVIADAGAVHEEPAVPMTGPIDTVGAGDTVVATLAAVLASGGDAVTAARLAMLAAAVTVKKLKTTGTATPDEIRAIAASGKLST